MARGSFFQSLHLIEKSVPLKMLVASLFLKFNLIECTHMRAHAHTHSEYVFL